MTKTKLETRALPSIDTSLRHQIGFYEVRQTYKPVYKHRYGYKIEKMVPCGEETVFHLLGWGDTIEKAAKMAARYATA